MFDGKVTMSITIFNSYVSHYQSEVVCGIFRHLNDVFAALSNYVALMTKVSLDTLVHGVNPG